MENNVEQLHRFNQPKLLANGKKLVSVQSLIVTGHQDFPLTSLLICDYGFHSFIPFSHSLHGPNRFGKFRKNYKIYVLST